MEKHEKKLLAAVFAVLFLIGLIAVQGYGINIDENTEIDIARMDLKEYVRLFFGEGSRLFQYMDGLIGDLMDSVEIDHGEAPLYPAVAVVSVLRALGRTDLGMLFYHMYIYMWFLAGLFAAYQVGKYLTGRIWMGWAAAAMIGLNPVLFGNAFLNNKDMMMLSLASICIWTGIHFIEEKTWKWSVLWAVTVGFSVNMRIVGLAYAGLFGGLYLLEYLTVCKRDRRVFLNGALAVAVMCLTFFAVTPATWYSIPGYFSYTLSSTASFLRWQGWELYAGELYRYLERDLPWHYFFVYFGISTPPIFLAALITGQLGCAFRVVTRLRADWGRLKYILICAVIFWAPMLFFIIRGANVTFRHYFFLYPEMVFMAVYVLELLCKKCGARRIISGALVLQALFCVYLLAAGHPFQATYLNFLAGKNTEDRFQYINIDCYKEALETILRMDDGSEILISSDNMDCYFGIKQAWEILSPEKKARIEIAEPETAECDAADYHVYSYSVLLKENMEATQGLSDATFCEPETKFEHVKMLDAYGKHVMAIYYYDETGAGE